MGCAPASRKRDQRHRRVAGINKINSFYYNMLPNHFMLSFYMENYLCAFNLETCSCNSKKLITSLHERATSS
jgi:hypothetical protein